jgi:hypothetical protein
MLDKYLAPEVVKRAGLVNEEFTRSLVHAYLGGKTYLYIRVWVLFLLHWWFETYGVEQTRAEA